MILSTIFFILQILPTFFCLLFYSLKEKRAYEHTYITHVKRLVIYIKRIEFHNPMSSPLTVFLAMIRFETFIPFYLKRNEYTYTYPWKHVLLVTFIFVLCNNVLDRVFMQPEDYPGEVSYNPKYFFLVPIKQFITGKWQVISKPINGIWETNNSDQSIYMMRWREREREREREINPTWFIISYGPILLDKQCDFKDTIHKQDWVFGTA